MLSMDRSVVNLFFFYVSLLNAFIGCQSTILAKRVTSGQINTVFQQLGVMSTFKSS